MKNETSMMIFLNHFTRAWLWRFGVLQKNIMSNQNCKNQNINCFKNKNRRNK